MDAALQLCPANACSRCGHERSCPGSEYAAVLLAEKGLKGHARALLSIAARYKALVEPGGPGRGRWAKLRDGALARNVASQDGERR